MRSVFPRQLGDVQGWITWFPFGEVLDILCNHERNVRVLASKHPLEVEHNDVLDRELGGVEVAYPLDHSAAP